MPAPTPEEVLAISSMTDTVVRNLRMTECYHRLSDAMAERVGSDVSNWCTFGKWAARQAGRTIRGEDLFSQLIPNADSFVWRALLRQGLFNPETLLGRLVGAVHSPFDAFERASFQVAEGNRKIFSEMALSFARYLQMCPVDAPLDSPAVQEFLAGFRPGGPPDGQDYLRRAFTRYQTLPPRSQPGLRAQAICLANIEAGVHEQTRVQREIEAALEVAPVTAEDLTRRLLKALSLFSPKAVFLLPVARFIVVRYGKFARRVTRHVITNAMMTLETPMSAGN